MCDFNSCKFDKDDIVKISPVKNMQEIKSISPIKSIEEVVGIYALTEDQAQRLKDSWSGYEPSGLKAGSMLG